VSKKLVHGGNPGWKSEYYGNHLAPEEEGYTPFAWADWRTVIGSKKSLVGVRLLLLK
jgi:hypothetical protein